MPRPLPPHKLLPPNGGGLEAGARPSSSSSSRHRSLRFMEAPAPPAPTQRPPPCSLESSASARPAPSLSSYGAEMMDKWFCSVFGTLLAMILSYLPLLHYLIKNDIKATIAIWSATGLEVGLANGMSWLLYTVVVYKRDGGPGLLMSNAWFCAVSLCSLIMFYAHQQKVKRAMCWFVSTMICMTLAQVLLQLELEGKAMLVLEYFFGGFGLLTLGTCHCFQIIDLFRASNPMDLLYALVSVGPSLCFAIIQCLVTFISHRDQKFLLASSGINIICFPMELFFMSHLYHQLRTRNRERIDALKKKLRVQCLIVAAACKFKAAPSRSSRDDIESGTGMRSELPAATSPQPPSQGHDANAPSLQQEIGSIGHSDSSVSSESLADDTVELWRQVAERRNENQVNENIDANIEAAEEIELIEACHLDDIEPGTGMMSEPPAATSPPPPSRGHDANAPSLIQENGSTAGHSDSSVSSESLADDTVELWRQVAERRNENQVNENIDANIEAAEEIELIEDDIEPGTGMMSEPPAATSPPPPSRGHDANAPSLIQENGSTAGQSISLLSSGPLPDSIDHRDQIQVTEADYGDYLQFLFSEEVDLNEDFEVESYGFHLLFVEIVDEEQQHSDPGEDDNHRAYLQWLFAQQNEGSLPDIVEVSNESVGVPEFERKERMRKRNAKATLRELLAYSSPQNTRQKLKKAVGRPRSRWGMKMPSWASTGCKDI